MKGTKKVILGSALAIALSASMIAGSTFALFTSESSVNIAVTSAKVNVSAEVANLKENLAYGSAKVEGNSLELTNFTPGDSVSFDLVITNYSTIAVKYNTKISGSDDELFRALEIKVNNKELSLGEENSYCTNYAPLAAPTNKESGAPVQTIGVKITLPMDYDNVYTGEEDAVQGVTTNLTFQVNAIQGNGKTPVYQIPEGYCSVSTGAELLSAIDSGETHIALLDDAVFGVSKYEEYAEELEGIDLDHLNTEELETVAAILGIKPARGKTGGERLQGYIDGEDEYFRSHYNMGYVEYNLKSSFTTSIDITNELDIDLCGNSLQIPATLNQNANINIHGGTLTFNVFAPYAIETKSGTLTLTDVRIELGTAGIRCENVDALIMENCYVKIQSGTAIHVFQGDVSIQNSTIISNDENLKFGSAATGVVNNCQLYGMYTESNVTIKNTKIHSMTDERFVLTYDENGNKVF